MKDHHSLLSLYSIKILILTHQHETAFENIVGKGEISLLICCPQKLSVLLRRDPAWLSGKVFYPLSRAPWFESHCVF